MSKRTFAFVALSFSVALLVLTGFQVYWIHNDFKVREDLFRTKVDEVLNVTASRLEKLNPRSNYKKITKRTQGITFNLPNIKGPHTSHMGFRVNEELSIDSNGIQRSRLISKDL